MCLICVIRLTVMQFFVSWIEKGSRCCLFSCMQFHNLSYVTLFSKSGPSLLLDFEVICSVYILYFLVIYVYVALIHWNFLIFTNEEREKPFIVKVYIGGGFIGLGRIIFYSGVVRIQKMLYLNSFFFVFISFIIICYNFFNSIEIVDILYFKLFKKYNSFGCSNLMFFGQRLAMLATICFFLSDREA